MPNLSAARVGILKNPLAIIGGLGLATAADPARCGDRRWRSFANGTRISVDPCPRRGRLYGASRGSTRIIGGFWIYAGGPGIPPTFLARSVLAQPLERCAAGSPSSY